MKLTAKGEFGVCCLRGGILKFLLLDKVDTDVVDYIITYDHKCYQTLVSSFISPSSSEASVCLSASGNPHVFGDAFSRTFATLEKDGSWFSAPFRTSCLGLERQGRLVQTAFSTNLCINAI